MRSRSLYQGSRVRNCGRDCLRTKRSPPDSTRSTKLETPPLRGSMRTGPAPTQLRERRNSSALVDVISIIVEKSDRVRPDPSPCRRRQFRVIDYITGARTPLPPGLPQKSPAVDVQNRPVNEARRIARQKHDRLGDFL